MREKLIWLAGFIVDVLVFTVSCTGMLLYFLVYYTLISLINSIYFLLVFEPMAILSQIKWWVWATRKFTVRVFYILSERLKKSYKKPVILTITN